MQGRLLHHSCWSKPNNVRSLPDALVTITELDGTGLLHGNVTIETLHDDVLLAIFASCEDPNDEIDAWHTLVHVCQRWRCLVFASPGHLNLQLQCTIETPVKEMLDIWPPLPIVITDVSDSMSGVDNIIAALEQHDRVREIRLDDIPGWKMDTFVPAMLEPFPVLESIILGASDHDSEMAVIPDSFLDGSAPQLQWLTLCAIPFPTLPSFLSSTKNLVELELSSIPRSGYISPEVMVTCLSAMPRLRSFRLDFHSSRSFPNDESRPRPLLARSTLPALCDMFFTGVCEYFEEFIARIDVPVIRRLEITFFHRYFYHFSELSRFIDHAAIFKSPTDACIRLLSGVADVTLSPLSETYRDVTLTLGISCNELDQQLRYITQLCSSTLLPFRKAKMLEIFCVYEMHKPHWEHPTEDLRWLDILQPFSTVERLYIAKSILTPVTYTLNMVAKRRITEVLPAIQELSIGEQFPLGSVLRAIEKFATTRRLFTHLDGPNRWVAS